jgi:acyl-coenzyme A thioesterase PaaI-like protein
MNRDGKEEVTNNTFAIVRKADEQARFNRLLGFRLDHVDAREGQNSFVAKPELIGNFHQGILHGGVISAVIDTTGGLAACASVLAGIKDLQPQGFAPIAIGVCLTLIHLMDILIPMPR